MAKSELTRADWEDYLILLYFGRSGYFDGCIDRAYRDFNRTLHGIGCLDKKEEIYIKAKTELVKFLFRLKENADVADQKMFDNWHKLTCDALSSVYREHGYDYFYVGQAQKWINMTFKYIFAMGEDRIPGFENFYNFCHVPIDNILLRALEKYQAPPITCAWSRLNDYRKYLDFQLWVRNNFDYIPMDVEFRLFNSLNPLNPSQ